ncbi:hypothetical protein WMY93_019214 [Mugilogobius chulae]|uniref:BTB domain-containing protein n=1 Tax=Mugilogobius chulae TaxID=88201 RepID=A0AAW0NQJ5_9GOBI
MNSSSNPRKPNPKLKERVHQIPARLNSPKGLKMSDQALHRKTDTAVIDEIRQKNIFCDAVLKVEDSEFPVHKVILCNSTEYFRAMFERWAKPEDREFTIRRISPKIMSLVLDWIYTKTIRLSCKIIQEVTLAADMLLLDELVEDCFQTMQKHMSLKNCIGIWAFSDVVISTTTRDLARRFILSRFEEVMDTEQFQQLTAYELTGFLEDDELNVKSETVVFQAILHWTYHDLENRRAEFSWLLSKVRVCELSFEFLENNVLNHVLVKDDVQCMSALSSSLQTTYEAIVNRGLLNSPFWPRIPASILLAIGGWTRGGPSNQIEAFDYKIGRWVDVTDHRERPRAYHGSVLHHGKVFCLGGFYQLEYLNTVRCLDLSTKSWHEMPPMYYRRCYVSVTVLNGCIYVMGGYNGQVRLNTAEVYDPQTNQWSLIAPMNGHRSDANCATLNGKIYICGGYTGTEILQTAECYCPETNQWTLIAPMSTLRTGVAVIAYRNHIYAVGGFDGNSRLRSVEAYNPSTDSWHQVAPMINPRSNFGIEVLNDHIFAVGGFDGVTTSCKAESYDPLEDTWSQVCEMNVPRSALNCCVISGLPNMANFTITRDALPLMDIALFDAEE